MNKTIHYRHLLLFAAVMALGTSFTACSSDDAAAEGSTPTVAADIDAVSFDAYTQRATTRAGHVGAATTGDLRSKSTTLGKAGFGVFAYYTDNFDYTPLYQPNFMYNEQVKWDDVTNAFKYEVTKYWPNEHGSQAVSADQDRVSFFAYLPYVKVDVTTGMLADDGGNPLDASHSDLQWGITGMKRNTLQGDPIIQYIASFDQSKSVDLCWATTGSSDITWSTNGTTQTIKGGYPWLNVRKPSGVASNDARIRFNFQHATAKLAVNVKTDFTGGWTPTDATKTKVWVRSIRFTGIAQKAALNLNNPKTLATNKARWMDYYGTNELELGESVTIHDGRKDGSEGVADAIAPNEAILGLNPQIVQNEGQIVAGAWKTSECRSGVTSTYQPVFCNGVAAADYVHIIPTGEKVNVEIVYDIETIDSKLPEMLSDGETQGSSVENRITKAVSFGTTSKFESGKAYTINLILGLKDVQFTAEVSDDWDAVGSSDVYLPNNQFAMAAGNTVTVTLPTGATSFEDVTITGLQPDKSYTVTPTAPCTAPTSGSSDANGELKLTGITLTANTTVAKNTSGKLVVTGGTPSTTTTINFVQTAKQFASDDPTAISDANNATITLSANGSSGTVTDDQYTAALSTVKVEKQANGSTVWTTLTVNTGEADSDPNTYKKSATSNIQISDLDGLANGDKIRVTVKVGDTEPVVKVVNVTIS